jgi:hypothetical protein
MTLYSRNNKELGLQKTGAEGKFYHFLAGKIQQDTY